MLGLNPVEKQPGFRHNIYSPIPEKSFTWVKGMYDSAAGTYQSSWEYDENKELKIKLVVPFNATATVILPDATLDEVVVNGSLLKDKFPDAIVQNGNISFEVDSGAYEFVYTQESSKGRNYNVETELAVLVEDEEAKNIISEYFPHINHMPDFI